MFCYKIGSIDGEMLGFTLWDKDRINLCINERGVKGGKNVSPTHVPLDAARSVTILQEVTATMPSSQSVRPFGEPYMVGKYWGLLGEDWWGWGAAVALVVWRMRRNGGKFGAVGSMVMIYGGSGGRMAEAAQWRRLWCW